GAGIGLARDLVGAGVQNNPVQFLQAIARVYEMPRQAIQQLSIGRHVGGTKVIEGLHNSGIEILVPNSVDGGARKVRVFWRDNPVSQYRPSVDVSRNWRQRTAQKLGWHGFLRQWMVDLTFVLQEPGTPVLAVTMLHSKSSKKGRQAVEIVLRVVLQRMVMTFGAFHAHSQKEPAHRGGDFIHAELFEHKVGGWMPKVGRRVQQGVPLARQ